MTETIEYCTTILGKDFKSIDANKYKEMCENFDCYEHFVGDKPVKIVLDIDYGRPVDNSEGDEYAFYEETTAQLIRIAKKVCAANLNDKELRFYVATSDSPSFQKWEHKVPLDQRTFYWKNSARIIIPNYLATRDQQNILIKAFNKYANEMTDWVDYCGYDRNDKKARLFDESIYSDKRKIRSAFASKPDENRPMTIIEGTFEDGVITAFFAENRKICDIEVPPALKCATRISASAQTEAQAQRPN